MNFSKSSVPGTERTLEDRLFRAFIYIGILVVFFLITYDGLFTKDYVSVFIEIAAGVVFLIFFLITRNKGIPKTFNNILTLVLIVFVNIGWITGSGVNLLNATIYFLWLTLAIILQSPRSYPYIFGFAAINILGLYFFQIKTNFFAGKLYAAETHLVTNFYISVAFLVLVGGYLVAYLKMNYNNERDKLNRLNQLLNEKSQEISYQNQELKMAKEALDQTVFALERRTSELLKVKETLEEKVSERTAHLMKLNERLLVQNRQLEQYAYITSHNLRAPIAQIKGLVNLLPNGNQFDDITGETLIRISNSAGNLDKVVSDLSEILRVEKGIQAAWQDVDLPEELNSVIQSLSSSISSHGINVLIPAGAQIVVKAMKPYVYSVLHNIIENAVKYADFKKEDRFIRVEFRDVEKYQLMSITDNGIGIDMDVASGKIFNMYQRFNNTHPGQGFGLFLVKSQMEAMEGKVEMESMLGHGTTFNLYFLKR